MTSFQTNAAAYELPEEAWWVQRWVELLNTYRFKKRLERGRRYAREGNILSLEFKGSEVVALVQGTAEESPFSRDQMQALLAMAEKGIQDLLEAQQQHIEGVTL